MGLCARNILQSWIVQYPLLLTFLWATGFTSEAWGQRTSVVNIEIRVTDLQHEQPIEQALVELLRFPSGLLQTTYSDSSGRTAVLGLQPGSYTVRASKKGFQPQEVQVDLRRGDANLEVKIQLRPDELVSPQAPAGAVSSRTLAVPAPAMSEFQKGAELLNGKKNPQESIPHFQKAIDLFPSYHEAYFLLGMAHVQMNGLNEARTALAKAIELDPKFLQAYQPLSIVLMSLKRHSEAEAVLLQAMELDKEGWQWPFELARCYGNQGQWDKALHYAQIAYDRPNPPTKVHLLMADLYSNTGNTRKAIEELEKFVKLDPKSPYLERTQQVLDELRRQKPN